MMKISKYSPETHPQEIIFILVRQTHRTMNRSSNKVGNVTGSLLASISND